MLRVGDPHVKMNNLKDSQNLIDFIEKTAKKHKVKTIEFLGDLFHSKGIVHLEVLYFWENAFKQLKKYNLRVLVGNHDQIGIKNKEQLLNALHIFQGKFKNLLIIEEPTIIDGFTYIPHNSDLNQVVIDANKLFDEGGDKGLILHQTVIGVQYFSGMYAKEAIDQDELKHKNIISGHIHKKCTIGNCFYPGSPKWDTMADANEDKGIHLYQDDKVTFIDNDMCQSIVQINMDMEDKVSVKKGETYVNKYKVEPENRNYFVLTGETTWINKISKKLQHLGKIKPIPTDTVVDSADFKKDLTIEEFLDSDTYLVHSEDVSKDDIKLELEKI